MAGAPSCTEGGVDADRTNLLGHHASGDPRQLAVWRGVRGPYLLVANEWVIVILLFLLGWRNFGFIVQG